MVSGLEGWKSKLSNLLGQFRTAEVSREELEALFFEADFPLSMVSRLTEVASESGGRTREALTQALELEILREMTAFPPYSESFSLPRAIVLIGVNGSGKTTVAGKMAHRFVKQGKPVVLAAADTFRAGAVEQLEMWGKRANVDVVSQSSGADPAAVAFDAWQKAVRDNAVLIADTAGRLHTKVPLVEQLKKVVRILGKDGKGAPHDIFLVLDSTLGQNALMQSREFLKAVPLTGLVVTKLDGTARGGAAISSSLELRIPIRYLGMGEKEDDLILFDSASYARRLFSV